MKTLFDNMPALQRNSDPVTSFIGANYITQSGKVSQQKIAVLKALNIFGPNTARRLGIIMAEAVNNNQLLEIPHKRLGSLVAEGYVERRHGGLKGLVCYITDAGIDQLKKLRKK